MTFRQKLEQACEDGVMCDVVVNDGDLETCYRAKILEVGDDYIQIESYNEEEGTGLGTIRLSRVVEIWADKADPERDRLNDLFRR